MPGRRGGRPIEPPRKCPECGSPTARETETVFLRCVNPSCPEQIKERLRYFCGRDQMDIEGVGTALADQLVDCGLVHGFADLYRLSQCRDKLISLERMGEKSADNLLVAIEKSKENPLSRLLAALNIHHVGVNTAALLAERFGTMDALAQAGEEDLQKVEGIGPELAASIRSFFGSEAGRRMVKDLQSVGVNMKEPRKATTGPRPFAGKTIVVTGTLEHYSRKEAQDLIASLGGKAAGSVSGSTAFVVAGADPGSKLDKARQSGIEVIDEEEFRRRAGET